MKKQQSKLDAEKLTLVDIQVFKAGMEASPEFVDAPKKLARFNIDIGQEIAHNSTEKRVRVRIYVSISAIDEAQKLVIGIGASYGIDCHFTVENIDELVQKNQEGGEALQLDLAATLFAMAYSTSRGIVLERTFGTVMGGVILPVVNPIKVLLPPKVEF